MKLSTASRKLGEIGVILQWNDGEDFPWFREYTRQDITRAEYNFNTLEIETLLARSDFHRPMGVNCELLAVGGFKLDNFGRVAGRNILECDDFPSNCSNPGRTDRCCITVKPRASAGVIHKDVYPTDVLSYILPHEIGHYLGLCHCGHDGFHNVMYTNKTQSFFDWGIVSLYWEGEPHFSLDDGKNAWRFIVDQLATCLGAQPTSVVAMPVSTLFKPETCAAPDRLEPVTERSVT